MKQIALTQGQFAIIDADDYGELSKQKWYAAKTRDGGYIAVRGGSPTILMHRQIMNAPKGMQVDHINHNQLDNRKSNLRICTTSQNKQNGLSYKNTSSKYKGVYWQKQCKKWGSYIKINGKQIHLGVFDDEEVAARTYDEAAQKYFGEYAKLNAA